MVSNAAFQHSREIIASMSLAQLVTLRADLDSRRHGLEIASTAFNITELLEKILKQLDFFEIFTVMRVNRAFRDTILGSAPLQRKLFMLCGEAPVSNVTSSISDGKQDVNPYIQDAVSKAGFTLAGCHYVDAANPNFEGNPPDMFLAVRFTISWKKMNEMAPAYHEGHYPSWRNRHSIAAKGAEKGSWALTRIVNTLPIRVRVAFMLDDVACRDYFGIYRELEPENATLGTLYDLSIVGLERLANTQIVPNDRFAADFVPGPRAPE